MSVKLLTQYHLEFLSLKGGCTGLSESLSLFLSNCHIVGNYMSWLIYLCLLEIDVIPCVSVKHDFEMV